jgi:hypothetical protein
MLRLHCSRSAVCLCGSVDDHVSDSPAGNGGAPVPSSRHLATHVEGGWLNAHVWFVGIVEAACPAGANTIWTNKVVSSYPWHDARQRGGTW